MKRFRFEIALAVVLALFVAWAWHKQEPADPLTPAEAERYVATIAAKYPFADDQDKNAMLARFRSFAANDDGRDIYMVNLLRFHPKMARGPAPASRYEGTPEQANLIYEQAATPLLLASGAFPVFLGHVGEQNAVSGPDPAEDNWSRILVVHYPSRRHFFDLLTHPDYLAKADFKSYAMHMALVPAKRDLVVPDLRFLAVVGAIIVFLLGAWLHALRRGRP